MGDRIPPLRISSGHRQNVSLSGDIKHNISRDHSLLVSRVKKVSCSSRYRQHQTQLRHFSIKNVESNGIIHTTIRSSKDNIGSIDNKLNDHESKLLQLTLTSSFASHHHNESVRCINNQNSLKLVKNKVQPVNVHQVNQHHESMKQLANSTFKDDCFHEDLQKQNSCLSTKVNEANLQQRYEPRKSTSININSSKKKIVNQSFTIASTDFHRLNDGSDIVNQKKLSLLPLRKYKEEFKHKSTRRRKKKCFKAYCCQYSPLCVFLTSVAVLLLAAAIIALLIHLIIPKTATSPRTTSTSTTSTSTSTTSTSTSATSTSTTTSSTATTTTSATTSTTTTITTSITTSVTTTTTTTTPLSLLQITQTNDSIFGIYNTTAGGSTVGFNGRYSTVSEEPPKAIDGLLSTKYLNYGNNGSGGLTMSQPGINTGFYVTPNISNASVACGLLFATGNDSPERDPITITLEGTNSTALNASSSWTLIYNGSTGIEPLIDNRSTYGPLQVFSNTIAYQSYRLLVTSQRGDDDSVQYGEAQIMGYY